MTIIGPIEAKVDQDRFKFGPHRSNIAPLWTKLDQIWQNLGNVWPEVAATLGKLRPKLVNTGPNVTHTHTHKTRFGKTGQFSAKPRDRRGDQEASGKRQAGLFVRPGADL